MIIKRSIVYSIYLYVTIQKYVLGLVIKLQVQFKHMICSKVKNQILGAQPSFDTIL